MYTLILDLLFFLAVFSAILTITARNPVMALLSLIAVFISVSGYLAIIGLTFLSLVYLIIYVGGIAVLFLFVIMMLDIKAEEVPAASGGVGGIDPFLIGVFSVLLLLSGLKTPYLVILFDWFSLGSVHISCAPSWQWSIGFATFSQLASLGIYLFTVIPVSVLLIGLILLLALISPIVLSLPGVTKPSSTNSPPSIKQHPRPAKSLGSQSRHSSTSPEEPCDNPPPTLTPEQREAICRSAFWAIATREGAHLKVGLS